MKGLQKTIFFFLSLFLLFPIFEVKAENYLCGCFTNTGDCTPTSATSETTCQNDCATAQDSHGGYLYTRSEWFASGGACGSDIQSLIAAPASTTPTPVTYLSPILNVNIPGVSFSQVLQKGDFIEVNFLGEYITGLYKYLLTISGIFAVLMLVVGGMQYVVSPDGGEVSKAKTRITNALTGLVLLFCVYLILYIVNPDLTVFNGLSIQQIPPAAYVAEDDSVTGTLATDFGTVTASNITGSGVYKIPSELIPSLQAAAASLEASGISLSVASSFRSPESQTALIEKNCQNPPGSSTCNPKAGRPQTCMLIGNNPANCPHTTGRALDIWGVRNGNQCVMQSDCLKSGGMSKCFADPCQAALISAMKAQGFCVLSNEAWHFEKPKMSSKCN